MGSSEVLRGWGAIIVSVIALLTFTGTLIVGFFFRDPGLLNLLIGAAIANATAAVQYWLGSSDSSRKKDDLLAQGQGRAGSANATFDHQTPPPPAP